MNALTQAHAHALNSWADQVPVLSIVCPFHNEEEGIAAFFDAMHRVLGELGERYEIVCVNDGSRDRTLSLLQTEQRRHPAVRVIDLSRNFGKEAALTAGIEHARGRAVIPIDADLQDPPELIPRMVATWREGYDVVLARRSDRASDSWAKRLSARLFYRIHNRLADVPIPDNVGDFRLMDRRVVDALAQLPERRRFMKGLFGWVGFRTTSIDYVRPPRVAGSTKFNGWGLWNLALEGITAFSTLPLRVWTYVGLMVSALAFSYAAFIVFRTLVHGIDVPGYASMLTAVLLLGGIQLIGLGVIGEYVGRIYAESKQRPVYLVRDIYEGRES